ncbi:hypothetical protein V8G54_016499 [Vigna mungo]|uniref:Uncharacterized protein n=1 Tax=Vigna mungo TaxID=3915 RepID=A0AAQ3NKA6_VIGMU
MGNLAGNFFYPIHIAAVPSSSSIRNAYAMGKVRMVASEFETATKVVKTQNASRCAESGGFVLWQINPDMWYVELVVGGSKVHAGCNGKVDWRHTPWLGAHTTKGPVRPLRRALQVMTEVRGRGRSKKNLGGGREAE